MVYALYSEGFRLGGQNSVRAAETGEVPLEYGPDPLANYEVGLKSQWLNNRLRLNVAAFLMKWDDIQIHFSSTTATTTARSGSRATSTAARPSRRASSSTASGNATERFSLEWSAFLASPSSRRTRSSRTRTRSTSPRARVAGVAEGKVLGSVEYTFPDFLPLAGDFWTRFSYTWQGETWDSLTAIEDNEPRPGSSLITLPHGSPAPPGGIHRR